MVQVEVRRSNRRQRTVSGRLDGDRLVVSIPGHFTAAQEAEWVEKMSAQLQRKSRKRKPDMDLMARSRQLSLSYFGGAAQPVSVSWVSNQNSRWGSCTIRDRTIRISDKLQPFPRYVQDYVLLHELAHLLHADHGPGFWALLAKYPHSDRARGFLDGVTYQRVLPQLYDSDDDGADKAAPGVDDGNFDDDGGLDDGGGFDDGADGYRGGGCDSGWGQPQLIAA